MKEIKIAKNAGFCFGVKRAVDIAINQKEERTYTLGPLIHNDDVINKLKKSNINPIEIEKIDELSKNDSIVIRSHGISPDVKEILDDTGLKVVDATCPYVLSIHKKVAKYYKDGYQIVIVGDKDHPEVIGINGWCNNSAIITKDGLNLGGLPNKVCLVAQTTERLINYDKVIDIISKQSIELVSFNTICLATKERQESAEKLSKEVDLMIVIGGKKSSNSRKLYEICKVNCHNTIFIENKDELAIKFIEDDNVKLIGITAGASTPDWIINEVIDLINNYM